MKKIINILLCIGMLMTLSTPSYLVLATEQKGYVNDTQVQIRLGAGTSYESVGESILNAQYTILGSKATDDGSTGCTSGLWYNIEFEGNRECYICSSFVTLIQGPIQSDEEFLEYIKNQGFPESYWNKLLELHKKYPNWIFKGINTAENPNVTTPVTWQKAIIDQTKGTRSLLQVTSTVNDYGYLSTDSLGYDYYTNTFFPKDGSNWYIASEQIVAYYLDPRNFLDEEHIFMFEDLTYHPSYQTRDVVRKILYSSFWDSYIDYYMEAAIKYNVSPLHIASRSRQEVGIYGSTMTSGTVPGYEGYYNFYGIGAVASANPSLNGLEYAKKETGKYQLPWTSPEKAIIGGAEWIVDGYINQGQYTTYFQKWDFSPTSTYSNYHQYMQNIQAPASESVATYHSYKEQGILNEAIVFAIPYYTNMPESTSLPNKGNPNNFLSSITINGNSLNGFDGARENYEYFVPSVTKQVDLNAVAVASTSSIDGLGVIPIQSDEVTVTITVQAQNGSQKQYQVRIVRMKDDEEYVMPILEVLNNSEIKNDGESILGISPEMQPSVIIDKINQKTPGITVSVMDSNRVVKSTAFRTGDIVSISNGKESKEYTVVIRGDVNGDGNISIIDLLRVQKNILGSIELSGAYRKAADINNDGDITILDLLKIQKHILGSSIIDQ